MSSSTLGDWSSNCSVTSNEEQKRDESLKKWTIPKVLTKDAYKQDLVSFAETINTVEQTVDYSPNMQEIYLLNPKNLEQLKKKYNYIHIGLIQVAIKPLHREGLNTSILLALRDTRFLKFDDSLIGAIETSMCYGPVHFNCYPDISLPLKDENILDALKINLKSHGYNMKPESIPIAVVHRIQYKAMKKISCPRALRKFKKG
ncbi:uncharacterized protein LOC122665555 [Telopea speciosissima]|uniref:uncharacterized protein LOC122665555 n=1 Tax=Telopea speciosissima TaxID=54955 RepID=UPI001CC64EE9|nr:uncharacterized protein LOC122665555 [Telopea speciosissima]